MLINSFFARNGIAATGLTPVISIWSVVGNTRTPVVTSQSTTELGDGFYSYDFTLFDSAIDYIVSVDAGPTMTQSGRYNIASITPALSKAVTVEQTVIDQIVDGVWDAVATDYTISGTTGEMLNHIKADTTSIAVDIIGIKQLLTVLKKYENNRTKIDTTAKTLTVYDDDKVTPIQVFNLKDSAGVASVAEVAERVPTL